jgi:hypothetical protein
VSRAKYTRLLEHCAAVALVAVVCVVIGWCLLESHQGVLAATGGPPEVLGPPVRPDSPLLAVTPPARPADASAAGR